MRKTLIVAFVGGLTDLCTSHLSSASTAGFIGKETRDVNIEIDRSSTTQRGTSRAQHQSMSHASKFGADTSSVVGSESKSTGYSASTASRSGKSMSRLSFSDPNKSNLQTQSSRSRSLAELSASGTSKSQSRSNASRSTPISQSKSAGEISSSSQGGQSRSLAEVLHFSDDAERSSKSVKQTSRSASGKSFSGSTAPTTINLKSMDDSTDLIRLALLASEDSNGRKLPRNIKLEETRTIHVRRVKT
jgi:hypothetical protein